MLTPPGDTDDDAHFSELDPDVDDLDELDVDALADFDDGAPTRSSILQPGPLSLAGLVISCVSFLSNAPVDNAIDARLQATTDVAVRLAHLAERAAVSRMVIAAVGLLLCSAAVYLDDETDPAWGRVAARAGIVVALVSLAVYAVAIVLGATAKPPAFTG